MSLNRFIEFGAKIGDESVEHSFDLLQKYRTMITDQSTVNY